MAGALGLALALALALALTPTPTPTLTLTPTKARSRQLTRLSAAGVALGVEEAEWLVDAGFALDVESDGVDLLDRASWPRWSKLL